MTWVPVSERLPGPDDGPEQLVWLVVPQDDPSGLGGWGYWDVARYSGGRWWLERPQAEECHPTHWMVPSPPPGWDDKETLCD